jgi:hypothetical protein
LNKGLTGKGERGMHETREKGRKQERYTYKKRGK